MRIRKKACAGAAVIILTASLFMAFSGCAGSYIHYIEKELGINLPRHSSVYWNDTHGGFNGDGMTSGAVSFNQDKAAKLESELSSKWNVLPLSDNLRALMYNEDKDGYGYDLASEAGIPDVENGWWYFCNRSDYTAAPLSDDILDDPSFNFTLAVYDSDNMILYFFEFDT